MNERTHIIKLFLILTLSINQGYSQIINTELADVLRSKIISKNISNDIKMFSFPAPMQLFPRDNQDSSMIFINGQVISPGYTSVNLIISKAHLLFKSINRPLLYTNDSATFSIETKIHAELSEYRFDLYLKTNNDSTLVSTSDSVVCGDIFLINGQSNAHITDESITYTHEFCRSFGIQTNNFNYDPYNPADTLWGLANADGLQHSYSGPLLSGIWGLRLQTLIANNHNIPVCIINGATGGSTLSENLRNNSNPMDLSTAYGRLLYRVKKSGVDKNIKAIILWQGESDAFHSNLVRDYKEDFNTLYKSWQQDFYPIEKIYIIQLRPGCGVNPSDPSYQSQLREIQRGFANSYPNIEVVASAGVPFYIGCHFEIKGYDIFAEQLFRIFARDFYGSKDTSEISSPDILRIRYTDSLKTTLVLEFNKTNSIIWPNELNQNKLTDYFYLDGKSGDIILGKSFENKVVLYMLNTTNAKTVSYLPDRNYKGTNDTYMGPFLLNSRGIGVLAFDKFPIDTTSYGSAVTSITTVDIKARNYFLFHNYPNPFNPTTTISFNIPTASFVSLKIFDALGREVSDLISEELSIGNYSRQWNATTFPSGVYFYRLKAGLFSETKKLLLIK